ATSGGEITANSPKRPGWSLTSVAPYSLSRRARLRASSTLSPYQTPGWTTESTAVAMPLLSMSASESAGDHFGGGGAGRRPGAIMGATWDCGGEWGGTSIRGFLGAPCAAAGRVRVGAAGAPKPKAAAPPARKFRRVGLAGDATGGLAGAQHRQLRKGVPND